MMDPAAHLPKCLQERLDSWMQSPPKWQHQAYGPLNAYFSLKFPPSRFLVKPQALLRTEAPQADDDDEAGDQSFDSIDSHVWSCLCKDALHWPNVKGAKVTSARLYPDFNIDQYWGADDDTNKRPDIVRLVVEVASLKKNSPHAGDLHAEAVLQLRNYLETVGERWDKRLVGLAILGKEAYLMHLTQEDLRIREVYRLSDDEDDSDYDDDGNGDGDNRKDEGRNAHWMSLFDPRVVQVLDEMHTLSTLSDDDDDDGDDEGEEDEDDDQ